MGLGLQISSVVRIVVLTLIYFSVFLIIAGLTSLQAPNAVPGQVGPVLSTPLKAILYIILLYFVLTGALAVTTCASEVFAMRLPSQNGGSSITKVESNAELLLQGAVSAVELAPMMCVIFLAIRFRNQEVNVGTGASMTGQGLAMHIAVGCLVFQAACSLAIVYSSIQAGPAGAYGKNMALNMDPVRLKLLKQRGMLYVEQAKQLGNYKLASMCVCYAALAFCIWSVFAQVREVQLKTL